VPTLEEINRWADDLERECPEDLPRRLAWFTRRLGIDPGRVLRLMGLPPDEVSRLASGGLTEARWDEIVERHPVEALWVEDAINHLLAVFHYNADTLADRLKQLPPPGEIQVPRPGGAVVNLDDLDANDREQVLLEQVARGGAGAMPALLVYLSEPGHVSANP
jgi:hypothetical protein